MIHPDIISLSGFSKTSYTYVDGTFTFTDEHFDVEAPGMMEHSVCISDALLDAMIAEREAARAKVEAYRVYGTDTDGSERLFTVVDATSAAEAMTKATALGHTTLTEAVLWK